ncbi:TPA: hypothetical protein N2E03_003748 [Clostridium botulinum]|nr:hypothetical protein [Clostridium botulinum]HCL4561043.1 hypothetical protein [Clostridium botulinum]HCL4568877.1 hypothetical protein [Clostridium botulinum]HCL4571810.1 hypothetical protein [Clostridium botulinum]HCL4582719.1 hypothetical protein [Clostridium botulinum]
MIKKIDFELLNISNIPNNEQKMIDLMKIFTYKTYSLKEIRELDISINEYSYETFRKMLNHSSIIGILECKNNSYSLSKNSLEFLKEKITFEEYINNIINENKKLLNYYKIINIIINIFPTSIGIKTFYNIFSYIGKDRIDDSAIASAGRNLRAVFSLLFMAHKINKYRNRIEIVEDRTKYIQSIYNIYNSDIINIREVRKYLNKYFDKEVSEKILQCMSTYEYENYIWVKGSLYKNNGEVKNLNNEFITTLMVKE